MRIDFDNLPDPEICWDWFGSASRDGYRQISIKRVSYAQHRYVYERLVGPIPEGHQIDHLCRNPPCCNPAHLEPVTPRENTLRGNGPAAVNAAKTHCKYGHELTDENTYWKKPRSQAEGAVARGCRVCGKRNCAEYYQQNKDAIQQRRRDRQLSREVSS